jgi:hypothetical protein
MDIRLGHALYYSLVSFIPSFMASSFVTFRHFLSELPIGGLSFVAFFRLWHLWHLIFSHFLICEISPI